MGTFSFVVKTTPIRIINDRESFEGTGVIPGLEKKGVRRRQEIT